MRSQSANRTIAGRTATGLAALIVLAAATWVIAQQQPTKQQSTPGASAQTETADDDPAAIGSITEITFERTRCFGTCPAYKLTLRSDGSAEYEGIAFVDREGRSTAKDMGHFFERMAQLARAIDFMKFEQKYSKPVTDLPSAVTSIVVDGKRKQVINYGNSGPIELWGFEMAADGVIGQIKWTKAGDAAP